MVTKAKPVLAHSTPQEQLGVLKAQQKLWQRDLSDRGELLSRLHKLRQQVLQEGVPKPPTFDQFVKHIRKNKGTAGKGSDQLSRQFVGDLCAEGQRNCMRFSARCGAA